MPGFFVCYFVPPLRAVISPVSSSCASASPNGECARDQATAAATPEPDGWDIAFTPAPSLFMSGNDPLRILRELEHLGPLQVDARFERLPGFTQLDPLEACIA